VACLGVGASLHATSTAILVSQGPVVDRGEGGRAFDCTYLGTTGFIYVSHFYAAELGKEPAQPRGQLHCAWACSMGLGPRYQGKQRAHCG
jgi:hypothetical protein